MQDLAVEHVGLLPQQMRIKGPQMAETMRLGKFRQLHGTHRGWVALQDNSEIHRGALSINQPQMRY
ncbi:Uncharacterised protein [Mycobacteroides abscessus subsp. abscessus]|nr:Uncharacterised protein [Mycobacteroides abscessus subsp. abscessus]